MVRLTSSVCSLSGGLTGDEPHIRFFWQTLKGFTDEQRRRFVRFVWAQERLPTTDDGWGNTRFLIKNKTARGKRFRTALMGMQTSGQGRTRARTRAGQGPGQGGGFWWVGLGGGGGSQAIEKYHT